MCIVRVQKKKIPIQKPLRLIRDSDLVLCTSSFVFILIQSTKTCSGCNICVTASKRVATSSWGNSYGLSSRTSVDGRDTDLFVNCNENAKPIDGTIPSNIFWFATYRIQISFISQAHRCFGDHYQLSAKDDSQNFQITSDLYRRATDSPMPNFVPQLPGLTFQLRECYKWAWTVG